MPGLMPGNYSRFQFFNNPAGNNFVNFHFLLLLSLNGFPSKNILKNQLQKKGGAKDTKEPQAGLCHARRVLRKYCSSFLEEYFWNDKDFHRREKE
jgi:hypothetical protein